MESRCVCGHNETDSHSTESKQMLLWIQLVHVHHTPPQPISLPDTLHFSLTMEHDISILVPSTLIPNQQQICGAAVLSTLSASDF